jgi:Terminase small subunit
MQEQPTAQEEPQIEGSSLAFTGAKDGYSEAIAKLTKLQRLYVEARLTGLNIHQSGIAAGVKVPDVNAYRLEKHPGVRAALDAASRMATEKMDLRRDDVLRGLQDAVVAAATSAELTAAWREIGKVIGAYEPERHEHVLKLEDLTLERLQTLPTAELAKMAEGKDFVVNRDEDALDAEYEVLNDSITPPEPIDYG